MKLRKELVENILSMSSTQEGMLYQYLKKPHAGLYYEQITYFLHGKIEILDFIKSWQLVIQKNAALRTIFKWEKLSKPVQVILKKIQLPYVIYDLTGEQEEWQRQFISQKNRETKVKGFDLETGPLFQITLYLLSEDTFAITNNNHHIILDGWSNSLILCQFLKIYTNFRNHDICYIDSYENMSVYLKWLKAKDSKEEKDYWQRYLLDCPITEDFHAFHLRKKPKTSEQSECECRSYEFSESQQEEIQLFVKENGMTSGCLFASIWGIILNLYADVDDVVFGVTVSGRAGKEEAIQKVVGVLMNTLPFRLKIEMTDQVIKILKNAQHDFNTMQSYDSTPLTEIQSYAGVPADKALFNTLIVVENYPVEMIKGAALEIDSIEGYSHTGYDILVAVNYFHKKTVNFIYNPAKLKGVFIERLVEMFIQCLEWVLYNSSRELKELDDFLL